MINALDTNAWGVQVLLSLKETNPEIYNNSKVNQINLDGLLNYADKNFKVTIKGKNKQFLNLYKFSNEQNSPVSFEWSMQMAVSYKMLADYYEYYERNNKKQDELVAIYRNKAESILKDIIDYSKELGMEEGYIPYSDQNGVKNYSNGGWDVFVVPSVCTTIGQRVQIEYGSFFKPLKKIEGTNYVISQEKHESEDDYKSIHFGVWEGKNWKSYATQDPLNLKDTDIVTIKMKLEHPVKNAKVKVQIRPKETDPNLPVGLDNEVYFFRNNGFLEIKIDMKKFSKQINMGKVHIIIHAGEECFGTKLNSKNLPLNIEQKIKVEQKENLEKSVSSINNNFSFKFKLTLEEEISFIVKKIATNIKMKEETVKEKFQEVLKNLKEEEKKKVIKTLNDFYNNKGASIINCAAKALAKVISTEAKPLALELLLADISAGIFVKNNKETIGSGQIQTSMFALQAVMNEELEDKGSNLTAQGYEVLIDTFIEKLAEGESAIVWVNGNHYITITKKKEGYSRSRSSRIY